MIPTRLLAGLAGDVGPSAAEVDTGETVAALLRVFMKDALVVAGRCALAERRRSVRAAGMRDALMYCARTFFDKDPAEMLRVVEAERAAMRDEEGEEGEEASGEEASGEEASGEEEASEEEASEETGEGGEDRGDEEPAAADVQLARNVATIVAHWHLWAPTDPVHVLIKQAIDRTPLA